MRVRFVLALLISIACTVVAPASGRAAVQRCLIYDVTATIDVQGVALNRTGTLVVFPDPLITETGTDTPANPWEFWFQLGEPATNPTPGSIYFATNSGIIASSGTAAAAQLQLADITWNPAGYFQVVPRVYEAQLFVNFLALGPQVGRHRSSLFLAEFIKLLDRLPQHGLRPAPFLVAVDVVVVRFREDSGELQQVAGTHRRKIRQ